MPTRGRSTLTQFLIESRRSAPHATGEFNALITNVSLACKAIARRVAQGTLEREPTVPVIDAADTSPLFVRATEWAGHLAGISAADAPAPQAIPVHYPLGKYLLRFESLDGVDNLDVNVTVGSIFSILRVAVPGEVAAPGDWLQPGTAQVCAGYAIYGPCTMLVITFGQGTHAFTLDAALGEWVLSHPRLTVPTATRDFAINASNTRFWEPAVKRYVNECFAGRSGPRGADFSLRWVASLVAEAHRILLRGGVFLDPRDTRDALRPGRLRLLHEVQPIAFLIEQAGGMASTGHERAMDVAPLTLDDRVGFVFGSRDEVERIERYHVEHVSPEAVDDYVSPLFGNRGLFARTE